MTRTAGALLLAWELVGIELQDAPIESIKITLKSPQAVPYVLIALVFYFAFRLTVEWHQSALERRRMRASLVDFYVAHLIGVLAIGLYATQRLLEIQIADRLGGIPLTMFAIGFIGTWIALNENEVFDKVVRLATVGTLTASGLILRSLVSPIDITWLIFLVLGMTVAGILKLALHLKRRRPNT